MYLSGRRSMRHAFVTIPIVDLLLLLGCAMAWYRAAEVEGVSPWIWAGASVFVYALTWIVLQWGIFGCLLGQVLMLAAITAYRVSQSFNGE
jgi:hypothetical protein